MASLLYFVAVMLAALAAIGGIGLMLIDREIEAAAAVLAGGTGALLLAAGGAVIEELRLANAFLGRIVLAMPDDDTSPAPDSGGPSGRDHVGP